MDRIMVVVNPASANGKTQSRWPSMAQDLREAGITFHHQFTGGSGDATRITSSALQQGYDSIISVGGDGTLNEVVNGFFAKDQLINTDARLGVIPSGTGGDFMKAAGIPKDINLAIEVLARNSLKAVDAGKVIFTNHQGNMTTRYFINVAGLGMEGEVVDRVNRTSKAWGGFLSFLWGTVIAAIQYRNREITLELDGVVRYQGHHTMVAVANGQYIGGGMKIAPGARLDSGSFDIVIVDGMSKLRMIRHISDLYQGTHLKLPEVSVLQGNYVKAVSREKVLIDVDGEQAGKLNAEFSILPKAIKLIC